MDIRLAAEHKVTAALRVAESLRDREYPQRYGREVAEAVCEVLRATLSRLGGLTEHSDPGVVQLNCTQATHELSRLLPVLGMIQRSQHSSIPFELYEPLWAW